MPRIHGVELACRELLSGQVQLKCNAGQEIAVDRHFVVLLGQAKTVKDVVYLKRCEPVVHVERLARAHVESGMKVEVDATKVDQEHAAGAKDSNAVVERRLDVIDNRHGELIQEAVELVRWDVVGPTEISDNSDFLTMRGDIERFSLRDVGPAEPSDVARHTDLEASASDIRAVSLYEVLVVVPDDRQRGGCTGTERDEPSKLRGSQIPEDRQSPESRDHRTSLE